MEQLFKKTKLLAILILAISFQGCEDDDEVIPQVIADFTYTLNEDSGTIRFLNTSEGASSYKWDFGNGETSTEINPIRTFATGTYTVSLEARNLAGATDTFESEITVTIPEDVMLPITFDGTNVDYTPSVFSGASFEVVDNPAPGGSNNQASKVGAITNSGAAFEGIFFDLGSPIDFTSLKSIQMDVWSQTELAVLVKLEEGTAGAVEVSANHSGSGWEELVFTFDSSAEYSRFTMFIDGLGTSSGTFYIDDIQQVATPDSGGGSAGQGQLDVACAGSLLQDYETADNSIFGDFGGGTTTIIDNPNTTVNMSAKVGQMQKFNDQPFGGTTMTLSAPADFANGETLTLDVFSQRASNLTFKLEGLNIEKVIPTSGTGWETMTFDFTGQTGAAPVPAITLIFDNGTNGDAAGDPDAWTFLFDNLRLCDGGTGGTGGSSSALITNGDFETGDETGYILFQNGGTAALDNTISNGGTWSGRIATNGPSNPAFKQERNGAGTVQPGDIVQIQFDHIGAVVQPGAVFNVILFGEGAGGASFTHVFNPAPVLSDSWSTFTGTYTIPNGTDVSEGISFLIESVCGGDAGCSVTANIDNISIVLNP